METFGNAKNVSEPAKDSRIVDEKLAFCKRVQGRILGVCNRSTREAIADLSLQAESTSQAESLKYFPPPPRF